jgi:hypothetical protein
MNQNERPFFAKGKEPIDGERYTIFTPMLSELKTFFDECFENRDPGAIVTGKPRYGKSKAIGYLIGKLIKAEGRSFPIFSFDIDFMERPTETRVWTAFLKGVKHQMSASGKADDKKERLITFILQKIRRGHTNRAVFFLDEAQYLYESQYKWLIALHNALTKKGVSPFFVLFGQPELKDRRGTYMEHGKAQIVGRFMVRTFDVFGVRDANDVMTCLDSFDKTEVRAGTGWTFTRFYYPGAYDIGWRLESEAQKVWDAFDEALSSAQIGALEDGIPMLYFTRAVESIFRKHSDFSPSFEVMWLHYPGHTK